jgi:hypothetical protein
VEKCWNQPGATTNLPSVFAICLLIELVKVKLHAGFGETALFTGPTKDVDAADLKKSVVDTQEQNTCE